MPAKPQDKPASILVRMIHAKEFAIFLFLLAVYVFLLIWKPPFRALDNQLMVVRQFSWIGIIAVGMTMVIITAGIDLSVGSVLALSACGMGKLVEGGTNVWLAVVVGLLIGAGCGFLNGLTITKIKIPPFIATLGMMGIARGATYVVTRARYSILPDELVDILGWGELRLVPVAAAIPLGAGVCGFLLVRRGAKVQGAIVVGMLVGAASGWLFWRYGASVWAAVAVATVIAGGCGFLGGLAKTKVTIRPLIGALGMMAIAQGIMLLITRGWYWSLPSQVVGFLGYREWFELPAPVSIMAAVAACGMIFLRHTTTGRYIYAVGGNEEAARLSGIRVDRVKLTVYTLTGFLAALAGIIIAARSNTAQPDAGLGSELNVIAAVIVGGTSLMGGAGTVLGTVIGAAILGIIPCALTLFYLPADWQYVAVGAVIILAVALDQLKKH